MWQEAMRRRRYLRDRAEAAAAAAAGGGGGDGLQRSRDWLYESYYCMSQQHPLIVFLLLIVMGACVALLAVFFALRLVSGLPAGPAPRAPGPREERERDLPASRVPPARGRPAARGSRPSGPPAAGLARARTAGRRKVSVEGSAQNKVARACTRWPGRACVFQLCAPAGKVSALFPRRRCRPHPLKSVSIRISIARLREAARCTAPELAF